MNKKLVILFEILFVLALYVYYVFKIMIPEYQGSKGSSDTFINPKDYVNLVEVKIDEKPHFMIVFNKNQEVYHLFFLDHESTIFYNQNIEGLKIDEVSKNIVSLLLEEEMIHKDSNIIMTHYTDTYYSLFQTGFFLELRNNNLTPKVEEKKSTLEELALQYELSSSSEAILLRELDIYSKEFVRDPYYSNKVTKEKAASYSDYVYRKLEAFVTEKNIDTIGKNQALLRIEEISVDNKGELFPNSNSWFFVDKGQVFAYIEIEKYGYCYLGDIHIRKEGAC